MKRILFFIIFLTVTLTVTAQQPVHDSQKEHQIRSMEQGHGTFFYIKIIVAQAKNGNGEALNQAGVLSSRKVILTLKLLPHVEKSRSLFKL